MKRPIVIISLTMVYQLSSKTNLLYKVTFSINKETWQNEKNVLSRKVFSLTKTKGMNRNPSAIILHNERNWTSTDSSTKQCYKYEAKAIIDMTQQNSICRICGVRNETINHNVKKRIIQHSVRMLFYLELSKKFKFNHTNKRYISKVS